MPPVRTAPRRGTIPDTATVTGASTVSDWDRAWTTDWDTDWRTKPERDTDDETAPAVDTAPEPLPVERGTVVGPRPGRVASDRAGSVGLDLVDLLLPWLVAVATLAARLLTAATGPTDWDSAQFSAAVSRFDVTHGRPQPPGYFLYVVAGRLVHATGAGTVGSLVLVSALASAAAAGTTVVAGRDLGGRWVGLAAGVLVATSPFAWFDGSIVTTYSFDLLAAPLLIVLAWRARPHSWHGAAALVSLGLLTGFRQSAFQAFALLALIAVVGSVRRIRDGVVAVLSGAAALAVWFVPMVLSQPGGLAAWARATRIETVGAVRATSVLDHAVGGSTNLGTAAAYTTVALAPLVALALLSACLLGIRGLVRLVRRPPVVGRVNAPSDDDRAHSPGASLTRTPVTDAAGAVRAGGALTVPTATGPRRGAAGRPAWTRPWYQSRTSILVAAVVPALALVTLVQFAKSGYLLAYLPGSVIALLLVPAALAGGRSRRRGGGRERTTWGARLWIVVASLAVAAIALLGAARFLDGTGVLPVAASQTSHGLWLTQARYQAPYPDTRSAIRSADAVDRALAAIAPDVRPDRDVVVIDSVDGGSAFYRTAGWALPLDRVALVVPGAVEYNEQLGSLYYASGRTVRVGVGGDVLLIAPPDLPGLARLAGRVQAVRVAGDPRIGDYLVWRVSPGATILGVHVVATPGRRPLGTGITG